MSSRYIERSKDPELSPVADAHIMSGVKPNDSAHIWGAKGGTPAWNSTPGAPMETGHVNYEPSIDEDAASGKSMFNAPGQSVPQEAGFNYKPLSSAGHSIKDDPFSLSDTKSWRK